MRLEITRRTDLATQAILKLAELDRKAKSAELAELIGTTGGFLTQALKPMVEAGWVTSEPGPTGGYALAIPLEKLSVLDVIEASEGPTDAGQCVLESRPCTPTTPCALHGPWEKARCHLLDDLRASSLAELARR